MKKVKELYDKRLEYSKDEQHIIESLNLEDAALQSISEMKSTGGWKILGAKLREELKKEIGNAVKDNVKINVLLDILSTVETKDAMKLLDDEIERLIPT